MRADNQISKVKVRTQKSDTENMYLKIRTPGQSSEVKNWNKAIKTRDTSSGFGKEKAYGKNGGKMSGWT